jgi:hypothetical protein
MNTLLQRNLTAAKFAVDYSFEPGKDKSILLIFD